MKKILVTALIGCVIAPHFAFAGAWTLPKGDVWMQYQMKWFYSKRHYMPNSKKARLPRDARNWGWAIIPEINYGVTDWLDVLFQMEYKEAKYKEYVLQFGPQFPYSVKNHGLVTIEPGVKVRFLQEPLVLSGQFVFSIWNKHYEKKPLEDRAEQPGISDRTNFWEIKALASKMWDTEIPFFMGIETGWKRNFRNVEDQVPLFFEFGFWPIDFLLLKTELDFAFGMHGTTKGSLRTEGRDNVMNKSWGIWRIGPSIELFTLYDRIMNLMQGEGARTGEYGDPVTRTGKSLNFEVQYGNTFWGRNTNASQEVVMKVSTQF